MYIEKYLCYNVFIVVFVGLFIFVEFAMENYIEFIGSNEVIIFYYFNVVIYEDRVEVFII